MLAVVLPAYNEEGVIERTIVDAMAKVSRLVDQYVIVVSDDGSRDRTGAILGELVARLGGRVAAVHAPENQGYGAALRAGFDRASELGADLIFWMDSDGQFDPGELAPFLPLMETHDAVIGYRIDRKDPWIRRANAWGWRELMRLLFGIKARDIDCAFKLVRANFLRTLPLRSSGAMISTEILAHLQRAHLRIAEVAVHHYPRTTGRPTGARPGVIMRAFAEAVRLRRGLAAQPLIDAAPATPPVAVPGDLSIPIP
jgi:glycosyltransferase involved in cell wall biosynthesis